LWRLKEKAKTICPAAALLKHYLKNIWEVNNVEVLSKEPYMHVLIANIRAKGGIAAALLKVLRCCEAVAGFSSNAHGAIACSSSLPCDAYREAGRTKKTAWKRRFSQSSH
jgi:hypothetical protein